MSPKKRSATVPPPRAAEDAFEDLHKAAEILCTSSRLPTNQR